MRERGRGGGRGEGERECVCTHQHIQTQHSHNVCKPQCSTFQPSSMLSVLTPLLKTLMILMNRLRSLGCLRLLYVTVNGLSEVLKTKRVFYTENGFLCSSQFCQSQLTTTSHMHTMKVPLSISLTLYLCVRNICHSSLHSLVY